MDHAGNTAVASQRVQIYDHEAPVIAGLPENDTIEVACHDYSSYTTPMVSAQDNCDRDVSATSTEKIVPLVGQNPACAYGREYNWTATDDCGHSVSEVRTFIIVDKEAPIFDIRSIVNKTFECDQVDDCTSDVTAEDACSNDLDISHDMVYVNGSCDNEYLMHYTFYAKDPCGNTANMSRTITVVDTTAPFVWHDAAADVNVTCGGEMGTADVVFHDNCASLDALKPTFTETVQEIDSQHWDVVRVWTATDACGNVGTFTQTLHVSDTDPPIQQFALVDHEVVIPCHQYAQEEANIAQLLKELEFEDRCCGSVNHTDTVTILPGNCTEELMVAHEIKAEDCHGNSVAFNYTIILVDEIAPETCSIPTDLILEFNSSTRMPLPVPPNVTDNCDPDPAIVFSINSLFGDECKNVSEYLWNFEDDCGNADLYSYSVTLEDTTPINVTSDINYTTVQCHQVPTADKNSVTFTDDFPFSVSYNETRDDGECLFNYSLVREWTAHGCPEDVSHTETLPVIDTIHPWFTYENEVVPNDNVTLVYSYEADCNLSDPFLYILEAEDLCSTDLNVTINPVYTPGLCPNVYTWYHHYSTKDDCDNEAAITIQHSYVDNTKPVMHNVPVNATLDFKCDWEVPTYNITATDQCHAIPVTFHDNEIQNGCPDRYWVDRTYKAQDCTGHSTTLDQHITVYDDVKPSISVDWNATGFISDAHDIIMENYGSDDPIDLTRCPISYPLPNVTSKDNCRGDVKLEFSESTNVNFVTYLDFHIRRTWTATDECGNVDSFTDSHHVIDNDPPIFAEVTPLNLTCGEVPVPEIPSVFDCDNNTLVSGVATSTNLYCSYLKAWTVTYTATDVNNNINVTTVTQHTQDIERPIFETVPEPYITVQCGPPPPSTAHVVSDCDPYVSSGVTADVTLMATSLVDTPTPASGLLTYDEMVDLWDLENVTGLTNSTFLSLTTRTYWAEDCVGNRVEHIQRIINLDSIGPIIFDRPQQTLNYSCYSDYLNRTDDIVPWAYDACTGVDTEFTETKVEECTNRVDIFKTWTFCDVAGNCVDTSQVINIYDDEPPIITQAPPAHMTVEYNTTIPSLLPLTNLLAEDNCGGVTWSCKPDVKIEGDVATNYTLIRECCAIDVCGQETCYLQNITVIDTTITPPPPPPPVCIHTEPNISWPADVVRVNFEEMINYHGNATCESDHMIKHIWEAWDASGNFIEVSTLWTNLNSTGINVDWEGAGDYNHTLPCSTIADTNATISFFTTQCNHTLQITVEEYYMDASAEDLANGIAFHVVKSFTATDSCGQNATYEQMVSFTDHEAPVVFNAPVSFFIEACGADMDCIPPPVQLYTGDDCTHVKPVYTEYSFAGNCTHNVTIKRIWTDTDLIGNTTITVQLLSVIDTTPPALTPLPQNMTVMYTDIPYAEVVTAYDGAAGNSSAVYTQTFISPGCLVTPNCSNVNYTIRREWEAEDPCGNYINHVQYIDVVIPTDLPVIPIPVDVTFECSDVITFASAQEVAWNIEAATGANVTFSEQFIPGGCPAEWTLYRQWLVHFDSGLIVVGEQAIASTDTTPPIVSGSPVITAECDNIPTGVQLEVADNCMNESTAENNTDILIYLHSETILASGVQGVYTLQRQYAVLDACGRITYFDQTVNVVDTSPPEWEQGLPMNETVSCSDPLPPFPDLTATDSCSEEVTLVITESRVDTACGPSYTLMRSWLACDEVSNCVYHEYYVTVVDVDPPVFTGVLPEDKTVLCSDIPGYDPVDVADLCDASVFVQYAQEEIPANDTSHAFKLKRTYKVCDACGNCAEMDQLLTVIDQDIPELYGDFSNFTIQCHPLPDWNPTTAIDPCEGELNVTITERLVPGDCGNSYIVYRHYSVCDNAGNCAQEWQMATVDDTTPPALINLPPPHDEHMWFECGFVEEPETPLAVDNCFGDPFQDPEADFLPVQEFITIKVDPVIPTIYNKTTRWSVNDTCGNFDEFIQYVVVEDTMLPVFDDYDPDLNTTCEEFDNYLVLNATDVCSGPISAVVNYDILLGECPVQFIANATWTATDDAGNTAILNDLIHVYDFTPPYWTSDLPNASLTYHYNETEEIPPAENLTVEAEDYCANFTIFLSEVDDPTFCPRVYDMVRTWVAADDCGNSINHTQTIHVIDVYPPTLSEYPEDVYVNCSSEVPPAPVITADDDGVAVTVVVSSDTMVEYICDNVYTFNRTFSAEDCAGNKVEHTQHIYVMNQEPSYADDYPTNETVACDNITTMENMDVYQYCDDLSLTDSMHENDFVIANHSDPQYLYTINRTWTAQDSCGEPFSHTVFITIVDITPPIIIGVMNESIYCNETIPISSPGATDTCDTHVVPTLNDTTTLAHNCSYESTVIKQWLATDDSGNWAVQDQYITILHLPVKLDVTWPVPPEHPEDIITECGSIPMPRVNVKGHTPCDENLPLNAAFTQLVYDADGYVVAPPGSVDLNDDTLNINDAMNFTNGSSIERTWTVTDLCGDTDSYTETYLVVDSTPPYFDPTPVLNDTIVECDDIPTDFYADVADMCDLSVSYSVETEVVNTTGSCPSEYTINITYTATDHVGLSSTHVNVLSVVDTTPPVIHGVSDNISVECYSPAIDDAWATDNCEAENLTVSFSETRVNISVRTYELHRYYTAIDECGNVGSLYQVMTVTDLEAPQPTNTLVNLTYEHITDEYTFDLPQLEDINFTDCNEFTVDFFYEYINGSCVGEYTIVSTWIADDGDRNTTIRHYTNVVDTSPPTFHNLPPNETTLEFQANFTWDSEHILGDEASLVYASDTSGQHLLNVTYSDKIYDVDGNEVNNLAAVLSTHQFSVVRTFYVIDDCGNDNTYVQIIYVIDTIPPVFILYPENITVECDSVPPPCVLVTVGENLNVSFTTTQQLDESNIGYIIHTWYSVDEAGNVATHVQNITVVDSTPPVFTRPGRVETFECMCDIATPHIDAIDNCDDCVEMVEETGAHVYFDADNPTDYSITTVYTAEDASGNINTINDTFIYQDTQPPVLSSIHPLDEVAADLVAECAAPSPLPMHAYDECTGQLNVTFTETRVSTACANSYTAVRSWSASDANGFTSVIQRNVLVSDNSAPHIGSASSLSACAFSPTAGGHQWTEIPNLEKRFDWADNCDDASALSISFVSCNSTQPSLLGGDSMFDDNCVVLKDTSTGKHSLFVKAETDGSESRSYSLFVQAQDQCGQTGSAKLDVFVPNDGPEYVAHGRRCAAPSRSALPGLGDGFASLST